MCCVSRWWRLIKRVPGDISTKGGAEAIADHLSVFNHHVRAFIEHWSVWTYGQVNVLVRDANQRKSIKDAKGHDDCTPGWGAMIGS